MKLHTTFTLVLATCFCTLPLYAQLTIEKHVSAAGGTPMASNQIQLNSTLGQPVIGLSLTNTNRHGAGFWYQPNMTPTATTPTQPPSTLRIKAMPNPFEQNLWIEIFTQKPITAQLTLHDANGKICWAQPQRQFPAGPSQVRLSLHQLPAANYWLTIHTHNGHTQTLPLIKVQ